MYCNDSKNNHNNQNESIIFCSRGFNSVTNTITLDTRLDPTEATTASTPFTQIGSIDVNIKNFNHPKILLNISNTINTNITQNPSITASDINVEIRFRISTLKNNKAHPISPEYIYSKPISLLFGLLVAQTGANITEVLSEAFEITFCNIITCDCQSCKEYILEYSSTLSATIVGLVQATEPILSLSSSISNVSINAIVSESNCNY